MDKEPDSGGLVALPAAELEALLERVAKTGARRALHEVGLDGQDAAEDTSAIFARCWRASTSRNIQRCRPLSG
jgi:hypothetical protein